MRLLPMALVCALAGRAGAEIDKSIIRHEIRLHNAEYAACYEAALKTNPKLEGTVSAKWVILHDGSTGDVEATGMPEIDACIVKVIEKIKFPKPPQNAGAISIAYPFVFNVR